MDTTGEFLRTGSWAGGSRADQWLPSAYGGFVKTNNKKRRRVRYWHGLGPCPDPLSVRRIDTAEMRGVPVRPGAPPECREYVYASTSWEVALAFSTLSGGGAVCGVEPGRLAAEVDPDFPTLGVRFHGPVKSISVEVVTGSARPDAREIIKTLAPDYLWTDRTPQYAEDGYLRAAPASRACGYVDEDFRWLGKWFPFHFLIPFADGIEIAFGDTGQAHIVFPPNHPVLNGRRRVPLGSLHEAWTRPGFYPNEKDMLRSFRERLSRADPTMPPPRMPWDW